MLFHRCFFARVHGSSCSLSIVNATNDYERIEKNAMGLRRIEQRPSFISFSFLNKLRNKGNFIYLSFLVVLFSSSGDQFVRRVFSNIFVLGAIGG